MNPHPVTGDDDTPDSSDVDRFTGMANRRGLVRWLGPMLDERLRHGTVLGLAFIDLDEFKRLNDDFGHAFGDDCLLQIAGRLSSLVPSLGVAARYGGDQFVLVDADLLDLATATAWGERLCAAVRRPLDIPTSVAQYVVTVSIGVTIASPDDGPEDMLVRADRAMHEAKMLGKDRVVGLTA